MPAESRLGSLCVIVSVRQTAAWRERGFGMATGLVPKLVSEATVGAFDKGILGRLSGRDIVPIDLTVIRKVRIAFEVNSVPLSLTTVTGLPRASISVASSLATLPPQKGEEVSPFQTGY